MPAVRDTLQAYAGELPEEVRRQRLARVRQGRCHPRLPVPFVGGSETSVTWDPRSR